MALIGLPHILHSIIEVHTVYYNCYTVETLQVGFTNSAVTINEDAGSVTLTIEINRSSWVSEPIIVRYSTSEAVGATNAASKV